MSPAENVQSLFKVIAQVIFFMEEKVQNIPISVNVLNDQQIENANIKDTTKLIRYIPNVYTKNSSSYQQINIRSERAHV